MNSENHLKTAEHRLIDAIKSWTGDRFIGDDCAVLPGQSLVTSDSLVEGTHFDTRWISWRDLGWKSLAVNLSDIAAMGGRPRYAVVSLTLPQMLEQWQIRDLYAGLLECAQVYRTEVVGGDLTRGPLTVVAVTVLGECHEQGCLRRSGARPGDLLAVTGDFGASAAGLWALQSGARDYQSVKDRHCRPIPRLAEGWQLLERAGNAGALMDASDGLADALAQIARASSVGMDVDLSAVPVSAETRKAAASAGADPGTWALYGGEDYELVASIPQPVWQGLAAAAGNPFKAVGLVTESGTISLKNSGTLGAEIDLGKSFQHW